MGLVGNAIVRFSASDSGLFRTMMRVERGFGTMKASYIQFAAATAGVALFGKVINDAIKFEAEMFNVRKTTGITRQEMDALGNSLKDVSIKTGIAKKQLAEIAVVAGQLGIFAQAGGGAKGLKAVEDFTTVIAKSRLAMPDYAESAEDAAVKTAKLLNVMNLGVDDAENMLSAFNELSNTTAATSGEIAELTRRIGGTATILGSSASEVAAFSATMVEVGVTAEVGGTAVTKFLVDVQKNLPEFSAALGKSGKEFEEKFIQNPLRGMQFLLGELNKMDKVARFKFFDEMNINGARLLDTLNKLSGDRGVQRLSENIRTSSDAFKEGNSLQKEFDIRLESTQSHVERLSAAMGFITDIFAREFFPLIKDLSLAIAKMLTSKDFQANVRAFGKAIAGLFSIIGLAIKVIAEFREVFIALALVLVGPAMLAGVRSLGLMFGGTVVSQVVKMTSAITKLTTAYKGLSLAQAAGAASRIGTADVMAAGSGAASILGPRTQARNAIGQFSSSFTRMPAQLGKIATIFAAITGAIKIATAWALKFTAALLTNPLTWIAAAIVGIALVVRGIRQAAENMERLKKFGEEFDFLNDLGPTGTAFSDSVENLAEKLDVMKDSLWGVWKTFMLSKDAIQANEAASMSYRDALSDVESKLNDLKAIGAIDDITFEKLFKELREGNPDMEKISELMEEVKNKIPDFQSQAERLANAFEQIREASPDLGLEEMVKEADKAFLKMEDVSEERLEALHNQLAIAAARNGEVGTAFGIKLADGMTAPEVKKMLHTAGITITDISLEAMSQNAQKAGDPALLLYSLFAQELLSPEKAQQLFAMGANLSISAVNGARQESLMNAMAAAGAGLGASMLAGLGEAVAGGVSALESHLGMSLGPDHPLRKFAEAADAAKKIAEGIKGGGVTTGSGSGSGESAAEKAAKEAEKKREEDLKNLIELRKKELDIRKKIAQMNKDDAEAEKDRLEMIAEQRDLTDAEQKALKNYKEIIKDANVTLAQTSSIYMDIDERIDTIIGSTKEWGKEWEKAKDKVADLRTELAELDKEIAKNEEDFKKMYGDDPTKIGGEAALALAAEAGRKFAELEQEKADLEKKRGSGDFDQEDVKRIEEITTEMGYLQEQYKATGREGEEAAKAIKEQEEKMFMLRADRLIRTQTPEDAAAYNAELQKQQEILDKMRAPATADSTQGAFLSAVERGRQINKAETESEKDYLDKLFEIQDERAVLNEQEKEDREQVNTKLKEQVEIEKTLATEQEKRQGRTDRLLDRVQKRMDKRIKGDEAALAGDAAPVTFTDATQDSAGGGEAFSPTATPAQNEETENQQRKTSRQQMLNDLLQLEKDHLALLASERTIAWGIQKAEMDANYKDIKTATKELTDSLISMWQSVASAASGGGSGRRSSGRAPGGGMKGGYADNFMRGYQAGGYTPNVNMFKPAGIVHGGEWVAPKWMVTRFPGLIAALETMRNGRKMKGFVSGGLVGQGSAAPHVQRSNEVKVEMTNHISSPLDMRAIAEQLGYSLSNRLLA